jgi:signal transduction histidine kinase
MRSVDDAPSEMASLQPGAPARAGVAVTPTDAATPKPRPDDVEGDTSIPPGRAPGEAVIGSADATGPHGGASDARAGGSLRLRDSLAARITALVVAVLLVTFAWGIVTLRQLADMQAGFDRLVQVYSVFDKRLAEAHVQAVRIGEQVRTHGTGKPIDDGLRSTLGIALQTRAAMVAAAREPIDAALRDPERFGGPEESAELENIGESLGHLQSLVAVPGSVDAVLGDVRTQRQIEQLFEALRGQSGRAIEELGDEVQQARTRAERWTLGLAAATLVVAAAATAGVYLTLRPLTRLASGVRRLGRGDWSQRVLADHTRADEVGRLAEEFNLMAEALEERERRLLRGERLAAAGQLAAQITHEIRNPLSAVALNAELLEDELPDGGEGRRLLGKIIAEVDRLTTITESYLHFARRPKAELVPMSLATELAGWLEFSAPEFAEDGVGLDVDIGDDVAMVLGDANQLRQALLNLLRNAKEAAIGEDPTAPREAPARVGVALLCKDDEVVVVVSDNGGGIALPPDKLDRIFEAFYTRKARGTGLGLPMVQQIVAEHGGVVRVAQTGPSGTQFELRLPACAARDGALSSQPANTPDATEHPRKPA